MLLVTMALASLIRQYYLDHFEELPLDKQFHFAGRLASWSGDKDCQKLLRQNQEQYVGKPELYETSIVNLLQSTPSLHMSAAEQRMAYFEKYPNLYGTSLALFRLRHLTYIYHVDAQSALTRQITPARLHDMSRQLAHDTEALRVLSTYAVNYLYLVEGILFDSEIPIPLEAILKQSTAYNTDDPEQLRLLLYLYTHCIIADSNFYARTISTERLPIYIAMLEELEKLLASTFDKASLDTKLEFLVAAQLCDYAAPALHARIVAECNASISDEGTFLIDRHNYFADSPKKSLQESEHRNVLFIMTQLPRLDA